MKSLTTRLNNTDFTQDKMCLKYNFLHYSSYFARYDIMRGCWHHDGRQRPTFRALCTQLAGLLQQFEENPGTNLAVENMQANCFKILKNPPGEKC